MKPNRPRQPNQSIRGHAPVSTRQAQDSEVGQARGVKSGQFSRLLEAAQLQSHLGSPARSDEDPTTDERPSCTESGEDGGQMDSSDADAADREVRHGPAADRQDARIVFERPVEQKNTSTHADNGLPRQYPPSPVGLAPDLQLIAHQVMKAASIHQVRGQTTLRLQLGTARLSRVDVDLKLEGGRIRTNLQLADDSDYRLVSGAVGELEASLRARGLSIDPVRVELNHSGHPGQMEHQERQHRPQQGQQPLDVAISASPRRTGPALPWAPASRRTDYVA